MRSRSAVYCVVAGSVLALALVCASGARGAGEGRELVLATTTSTQDTGLLDALLPPFEKETGITVKVIAVGTGQALALGRRGDADVLLVHAPQAEKAFMAEGYGAERRPLMYNDFVLVGPTEDPAGVRGMKSAIQAFGRIAATKSPFVSRGDNSGTHMKERELWASARVRPSGPWYLEAGSGMAATLRLASEKGAYTLSDRGTYLAQGRAREKPGPGLELLCEGAPVLRNPYAVITVSPDRFPDRNAAGARKLVAYLLSEKAQRLIAEFGKERYGQPLFHVYPPAKGGKVGR